MRCWELKLLIVLDRIFIRIFMLNKVVFSALKVTLSFLKTTFSRLKVILSDERVTNANFYETNCCF
jgi:hypothetical protein